MAKPFFFANGIDANSFATAISAAEQLIQPLAKTYQAHGWDTVCGASGTFRALQDRLRHLQSDHMDQAFISATMEDAISKGEKQRLVELGIREDRIAVFCGGLAILLALVKALDIKQIDLAQGALREGLVHTMLAERGAAR